MLFFRIGLLIVSACVWLIVSAPAFAIVQSSSAENALDSGAIAFTAARYDEALPQRVDQSELYRDRGASYIVMVNYVAAVTDFNAAISRNPGDIWAYFNRGSAYHRNNNFLSASQDFD